MRGFRDVGFSFRSDSDLGISPNNVGILAIDLAAKNSSSLQYPAGGSVRTYPCEGTLSAKTALGGETPNPVPGRDLGLQPLGTSVAVVSDVGSQLLITNATMTNVMTGLAVVMRTPTTSVNDPNPGYLTKNEAYISADAPTDPHSQYRVSIKGSVNGFPFTRNFVFGTGV